MDELWLCQGTRQQMLRKCWLMAYIDNDLNWCLPKNQIYQIYKSLLLL